MCAAVLSSAVGALVASCEREVLTKGREFGMESRLQTSTSDEKASEIRTVPNKKAVADTTRLFFFNLFWSVSVQVDFNVSVGTHSFVLGPLRTCAPCGVGAAGECACHFGRFWR